MKSTLSHLARLPCLALALIGVFSTPGCVSTPGSPARGTVDGMAEPPPTLDEINTAADPLTEYPPLAVGELKDQNGALFKRKPNLTHLVYILVDFRWGRQSELWTRSLTEALEHTCQIVLVLDARGSPRTMMEPVLNRMIRTSVAGRDAQIYIDWDGGLSKRYDVDNDSPAIICLNEKDNLIRTIQGEWTQELADQAIALYPGKSSPGQ